MDSIFQIKINENKLQRILSEISKGQGGLVEELAALRDALNRHVEEQGVVNCKMDGKFCELQGKLEREIGEVSARFQSAQQRVQSCIANTHETHLSRMEKIDQMVAANFSHINQHKSQLAEKLAKIHETLEAKNAAQQEKWNQDESLPAKVQRLEKFIGKIVQVTELLQNKNFIYFLQMMIDRQQTSFNFKPPEQPKQSRNPFSHESGEDKLKRYRDLKKLLQQTHTKIESMQSEYTGYFYSATQNNKQNREQTHLHYAFLSTKIKQMEEKMLAMQIQNTCVEKILYPSQGRRDKFASKAKIQSQVGSLKNIGVRDKGQILAIVKEELEPVRQQMQATKKQLKKKLQKVQDQLWSHSHKLESQKCTLHHIKVQIDKCTEKLKTLYSSQKDQINSSRAPGLLGHFRNLQDELQEKIKEKVDGGEFKKSVMQHGEKFRIIGEQIQEKANREETRKAFNFFEEKIREIVTILAEMKNSSRKTAGRKMMVQCLSCDENFFDQAQSTLKSRPTTSKLISPRTNSTLKLRPAQQPSPSPATTQNPDSRTLRRSNF